MTGLFLARLPLLAALCAAVAVLGWAVLAERRRKGWVGRRKP